MEPSEAPSSPSMADKPLREVACQRCRQRRSYCSKEAPSCLSCRKGGHECTYEVSRKITVNESYLRQLEDKARAYEQLQSGDPARRAEIPARDATQRQTSAEKVIDDDDFEDEHPLLQSFNSLRFDGPSTSFKGPGASDNFLRSVRSLTGLCHDDERLDLTPDVYEPNALPLRRQYLKQHVQLPPLHICRHLFAAQYTYIGTIFAFNDPDVFDRLLVEANQGLLDLANKDACLIHAKLFATLAFGQLYSVNQWISYKGPPGFEYFTYALQLLPDAYEEGSVICVETLALIGYFLQNLNRRDAAFLYIGMALRMAISLGLHQEISQRSMASGAAVAPVSQLDDAAKEHRRRVWWSIYSLDRIVCVKSGNPVTIRDEDIGIQLPSRLPYEPEYCPAVVLRHYTELSRILGDIAKSIYHKPSIPATGKADGKQLVASVQHIIHALYSWKRNIPDRLRFDPARLLVSRESVSTFSHYYQCINMTARPLFFRLVGRRLERIRADAAARTRDWRSGLSRTAVQAVELCVDAATDTIKMMKAASERDLVATYGYMDGEHVFSASIVLVMACASLPDSETNTSSMNVGLGLLRSMAERGNSYMAARYELLAHLRDAVVVGAANAATDTPAAETDDADTNHVNGHGGDEATHLEPIESSFLAMSEEALEEMVYDGNEVTGIDFGLWDGGFTDDGGVVDWDMAQWTQAAQVAIDSGLGAEATSGEGRHDLDEWAGMH